MIALSPMNLEADVISRNEVLSAASLHWRLSVSKYSDDDERQWPYEDQRDKFSCHKWPPFV